MIVLDCSAVIAMVFCTEEGAALRGLMLAGEQTIAPKLLYCELAHALTKYVRAGILEPSEVAQRGNQALRLVDEFVEDESLWVEATTESARLGHSSYDLFYFVLARRRGATLLTLDKKLALLCEREGVNCVLETKA